jgi:hypothetical protein
MIMLQRDRELMIACMGNTKKRNNEKYENMIHLRAIF